MEETTDDSPYGSGDVKSVELVRFGFGFLR
jgi:hypothetical protein